MKSRGGNYALFAVTAPGLEAFTARELRELGLLEGTGVGPIPTSALPLKGRERPAARDVTPPFIKGGAREAGGVAFQGDLTALYRANLHLRTASRILVRLGEFRAAAFPELRRKASELDWRRFLRPGQSVAVRAVSHRSKLYHAGAVAERVAGAIGDALGQPVRLDPAGEDDAANPPQLVVVRLVNDHCTISIDSSGELLHRRGYRQAVAKAPLCETLAAAILLAAEWDPSAPFLDPFCGSGTLPIEAALLALGLPPGRNRRFAFMDWPGFERKRWDALLADAKPRTGIVLPPILASDRDAGAVRMAQENAERAGVAQHIQFTCQAVSAIEPPPLPGWVITNPPYGIRVSGNKDLRNLYAQLGNVLRKKCPGWHVAVLCSDLMLLGQARLPLDTSLALLNGGIRVRLGRGMVATPSGI